MVTNTKPRSPPYPAPKQREDRPMRVLEDSPDLRWFEEFAKCRCGKPSNGILRGSQNQSFGYHCKRCAEKRLKASERVRAALAKSES